MAPTRLVALALTATVFATFGCGSGTGSGGGAGRASGAGSVSGTSSVSGASGGGGGGGGGQASKRLTRAELIARADAICRRVNTLRHSTTITSRADLARVLPPFAAYEQSALVNLTKLTPPASMKSDWNKIVANFRILAGDTEQVAEHAKSNTLSKVGSLSVALNHAGQRVSAVAARDGFKDCSQIIH
jgi:hypothetical protein